MATPGSWLCHLRREITIDSRRVYILQTHCSKCTKSNSTRLVVVLFFFSFFLFPYCETTTTWSLISIRKREHSVPSTAQSLIQVIPISCSTQKNDLLVLSSFLPALVVARTSSWREQIVAHSFPTGTVSTAD